MIESESDDEIDETFIEMDDESEEDTFMPKKSLKSHNEYSYIVMTPQQITDQMNNLVNETASIMNLDVTRCRLLLHHFKWDKQCLFEK